jgi:outer membrane biosynthesis protein TonB
LLQERNKNIQKGPSYKGKGIAGTLVIHLGLGLLLVSLSFTVPEPQNITDGGLMVNFGTGDTGFGDIEPSPPAVQEETVPPPPAATTKTEEEALIAEKDAETPKVKKVDPETEKKKLEKIEADKKIREEKEAERKIRQAEEAERKRIEAEQQRQTDIMNRTKNALANSKNAGTSSTSEGIAGGTGNQGVVTGSVDSKVYGEGGGSGNGTGIGNGSGTGTGNGISYDLGGRGVQNLFTPEYKIQTEGIVVVDISVDQNGNVTQAAPGGKGSTVVDADLYKIAKDAALKTKFVVKKDAVVQKGTIKYIFKLK